MFTRIIQLLQRNRLKKIFFLIVCFSCLATYPVYKNYINGEAATTYERHIAIIENRAQFYNPWQYRILCPLIIEGAKYVYDHTIDKIYPVEKHFHFYFNETSTPSPGTKALISSLQQPDFIRYLIIFLSFRFVENILVFLLGYLLLSYFVKNDWLIFFGLIAMSWSMGNSVFASDLTFNTYLDNIFYLLAGNLILYKKNLWYIIPITLFAALNRETSLMLPWLLFISFIDLSKITVSKFNFTQIKLPPKNIFIISACSFIIYCIVFVAIRRYFGYRQQSVWKVPAGLSMLKLNLFSVVAIKSYFEMIGAFSVIPLICLYKFRKCSYILRAWFIGIVPAWFLVHLYSVVTYESRLFLVPTFLILMPMFLQIIESNWQEKDKLRPRKAGVIFKNILKKY